MNEKEAAIRERREIEATRKNMMGAAGKLGTIVKYLGQPIESEDAASFQSTPMPDFWSLGEEKPGEYDPTTIRDWEEGTGVATIGWVFDGLARGMHLEIKYLEFKAELTVSYRGYAVYSETSGHLDAYAPFAEWEDMVEQLFLRADQVKQVRQRNELAMGRVAADREATGFLQRLRLRWGI